MQTPKTRTSSSEVPRKVSPRASSSEAPRKVSSRAISLEVPSKISPRSVSSKELPKVSPRVVRQLKTELTSSLNRTTRTSKDYSPKIADRKAPPRSLVSEPKQRPSKIVELESQISQLENDLEKVKDQLISSEAWKKQAQKDAEELKNQLLAVSLELEQSQKQLSEPDPKLVSELESTQEHSVDSGAFASAVDEIEGLNFQLEKVAVLEASEIELRNLKEKLDETHTMMEDLKDQLRDCKESEAHAQTLVAETLIQLEMAKKTVEMLRSDSVKSNEAYDAVASELEQSRARVNSLEELVNELKASEGHAYQKLEDGTGENEVEQLRSALEAAEIRYNEEQTRGVVEIRSARELVEKIKSSSSQRETELVVELKKSKTTIEELKADLMDKETELQGICEENEFLNTKLKNVLSGRREFDLEKELEKSMVDIENLKASEIKRGEVNEEVGDEVEAAKVAEQEAQMNIDKNNKKVTRVSEQLKAAQEANSELEAELRMLKVQADQWRKAAETAAAMLSSSGNNAKIMERTGSIDNHFSPNAGKIIIPFSEDVDGELLKRKNSNVLRKIGVFRKKTQK